MGTVATIQARIEAQQTYDALIYGQRTLEAMRGEMGCREEYGAPGWAIAQFEAAKDAAATFGLDLCGSAEWNLKRAKKLAADAKRAADAECKAIGTARQIRLALAA